MSLSLLLKQNNLGPFFLGSVTIGTLNINTITAVTITATTINATTINANTVTALSMAAGVIDATTVGGLLNVGTIKAGQILFGNTANTTNCDFTNSSIMTLVKTGALSPYIVNGSAVEISSNINLSAAVNVGTAKVVIRRIGNWVDLFVEFPSIVSVGITNTNAISLVGALPNGYRPPSSFTFSMMVVDTGLTPNNTPGQCTIQLNGDLNIRVMGPSNWTGGANWGFDAFSISFPVI